jgi:hypothetical protein
MRERVAMRARSRAWKRGMGRFLPDPWFLTSDPWFCPCARRVLAIKRFGQGHLVDALAPRGDEGRGTLRKAGRRGERSLIPGSPNGATHPRKRVSRSESIGSGGEPGELKHLSSRRKGHQTRLRE